VRRRLINNYVETFVELLRGRERLGFHKQRRCQPFVGGLQQEENLSD